MLRRLYLSSQNWLHPTTRLHLSRTPHAASRWRSLLPHTKFSTVNEGDATAAPVMNEPTALPDATGRDGTTDWSKSYSGLSSRPFAKEIADVLMAPLDSSDVEVKPGEGSPCTVSRFLIIGFRWFTLSS